MSESLFILVMVLIFGFALTNGFLDGGGIVSTVISTRVLDPLPALLLVAVCEVAGVFLLGRAVAHTMGVQLLHLPSDTPPLRVLSMLFSGMVGAMVWNTSMWWLSKPSSSSHALLGGLMGSTWAHFGMGAVAWPVVKKILIGLGVVPFVALGLSFLLARFLYWGGQYLTPAVGRVFRGLHILVLALLAMTHGSNDGQKSIALVFMALLAWGQIPGSSALLPWTSPSYVVVALACGMTIGLGVIVGSRRTFRTVSQGFYRVQSLQGLCAETSAMFLVGGSSLAGFPMATSHVMASSVLGAGAAVRPRGIRWDLAMGMAISWLFTIPAAAVLAALFSYVVS